jgi:hypothetical protein
MMMRRRPLLRTAATAAVVGGVAYHAGKGNATRDARMDAMEAQMQEQQLPPQPAYAPPPQQYAPPPQQYAPPPPPSPTASMSMDERMAALERLGQLRQQGILTDEEFAVQKHRLLEGG